MRRLSTKVMIACAFGMVLQAAHGGLIETSFTRTLSGDSTAGSPADPIVDDPDDIVNISDGQWFDVLNTFAEVPGGEIFGSSGAGQNTTIDTGTYVGTLFSSASALSNGTALADAFGQSSFEVNFEVDSPMTLIATGSIEVTDSGAGFSGLAELILLDLTPGPATIIAQTTDGAMVFDEEVALNPGIPYALSMLVRSSANRSFAQGSTAGDSDIVFDLAIVPEPSTASCLITLGAMGLWRRKRQRAKNRAD